MPKPVVVVAGGGRGAGLPVARRALDARVERRRPAVAAAVVAVLPVPARRKTFSMAPPMWLGITRAATSSSPTDHGANNRVAKFTPDGVFIKSFGQTGSDNNSLNQPSSLAVDAAGNVYVADLGNKRIQVLSNDLTSVVRTITGVGAPAAVCVSGGAHPYLYASNSNPVNDIDSGGEIYRLELNGTVTGKFGRAGKAAGEFGSVNQMDCRGANTLLTAEVGNYRVQKVTLK